MRKRDVQIGLFQSLVFLILIMGCNATVEDKANNQNALFTLLSSEQTGAKFINEVEDQKDFNILTYRNYYNGGGVGIGDLNNDGLEDIYLVSNMHSNRLFLNKGDWQFEDITDQAKVEGNGFWSTGVALADVNHDGWLDIYVCNSGDVGEDDRKNELFINQGNLTFIQEAGKYGLDSDAFSTHASFFDYDLDGDLDCFLLNNSFRSPDRMEFYQKGRDEIGKEGGDKLYRNDDGYFTDVTVEAGIATSDIGFGLGVSVSDLNNDMLPDIYISNDFWERDYLYINMGDGTFEDRIDQMIATTSMNSMGSDIADINNDGYPEIMTTDMLPPDNFRLKTMTQFSPFRMGAVEFDSMYHHQIMQNSLQLNQKGAYFTEMAHLAGVAASDWSWGALILDLNLDGWKDVFVSNGIQRDLTDFDFVDIITNKKIVDQIVEENDGFDFRDFLPFMPSFKIANTVFINNKNLIFEDQTQIIGFAEPSFSNGSAYGDLDNDGDLDLVTNNANMESFLYKNNTVERGLNNYLKVILEGPVKNPHGVGAKVEIKKGNQIQALQQYLSRGFQSSVAPGLIFGVAQVDTLDTVRVIWPDKKMQILGNVPANQKLVFTYNDADLTWTKEENTSGKIFQEKIDDSFVEHSKHSENPYNDFRDEGLLYKLLSAEGPRLLSADLNGDELDDVVLLGSAGVPNKLFTQEKSGRLLFRDVAAFISDKALESTCGALIDHDGDDDLDILIGHGGNEFNKGSENFRMRLYDNDGKGNFTINITSTPSIIANLSCIEPCDFDQDGDTDLFIGSRVVPGHYGLVPSSFLLLNNGDGRWANVTTEEIGKLGMVTDAEWSDYDKDGDPDLIVVGDWMPITLFENSPGALKRKGVIKDSYGWWSALEAKDLDNDGDDDYVLGNWGLNSKFRASAEQPLKLYIKDFDRNGKIDQILEWYPMADKIAYPFVSKDDLVNHIPQLSNVIETYKDYGTSTYEQLFTEEQREGAVELTCTYLKSAILWRDKEGFRLEALDLQAQMAPIFSIVAEDIDQDDIIDLMVFGNLYGLRPDVGRLDGNRGVYMKGKPEGKFELIPSTESGLFVRGQVRDAVLISDIEGKNRLVIARNNLPAQIYKIH
jgi:hypothetical protein